MPTFELPRHAHMQIAFFLRQLTGFWFFMLGRWKLFDLPGGARTVADQFFVGKYGDSFLPVWSLRAAGWFDPYAEFICGILLIIGLGVRPATWMLMGLLVMVTFGHMIDEPITYSMTKHIFPAAIGLIGIAWLAGPRDLLSLDTAIRPIWRRFTK
jgi:uncharacterized membrane protein YphA (DoxX/SURF4 family)